MSSTYTSPQQRRQSKLPLELQPHHVTFALYFTSIVVLGTAYSVIYGTHLQNVRISSGVAGSADSQFPSTLPRAAVAPAPIQNGVEGNTNLGPIPPTILLPPHHALNYWANRKNIVNQIFVKKAWLWTTIAWFLQLFFLRLAPTSSTSTTAATTSAKPRASAVVGSRVDHKKDEDAVVDPPAQATIASPVSISVLRYLIATALWLVFANWFFGPPLSERILTATGAVCVPSSNPNQSPVEDLYCRTRTPLSTSSHPALFSSKSATSKSIRAMWKGGHDISGHTFIMVLSSLLLLEDVAPYLSGLLGGTVVGGLFGGKAKVRWTGSAYTAVGVSVGLVGLWSWMLLNTAVYFHTPQEKVSGLVVALLAWLVLPKGN
ncbi:related to SCS3-protein required for inositol prototrophy [Sporisorium scitamineum]|uniref:Related to SCS3-protein required for inositol prototrophy n=1 Tax=Sporisorium scitamineum TaxID=49012 RepID=A0A0F7S7A1_9BASI|nr:related to SCS3-protein required for inositol prototrophy [Sporisorium scitamineum]CDW97149.1 hypothetical protein [Sporisorium scitamineum]